MFFLLPIASAPSRLIGIAIALLLLLTDRQESLSHQARSVVVAVLTVIAAANFVFHLAGSGGVFPFRLGQVTLLLGFAMAFVTAFVTRISSIAQNRVWTASAIPALLIVAAEAFVSSPIGVDAASGQVSWHGSVNPDSTGGTYFAPGAVVQSVYPDNPTRYFDEPSSLQRLWKLTAQQGSTADLAFPDSQSGVLRVAIGQQAKLVDWHIDLSQSPIRVRANAQYELRFRARADSARSVYAGVAQAHDPWAPLGLYSEVRLDTAWRRFAQTFRASADDSVARILFNVGAETPSIELSEVTLWDAATQREVRAESRVEYSVTYALNEYGCRGTGGGAADSLAKPIRILALGDGSTMGVGVHVRDTYAARLQALLNGGGAQASPRPNYEVVNCGSWGAGTDEERRILRRVSPAYAPRVVLLAVSPDDGHFSRTEGVPEQRVQYGKIARLFHVWALVESSRAPKSTPPNMASIVAGVRGMALDAQASGARVGVVLFRTQGSAEWTRLDSALTTGLRDLTLPTIDLGKTLQPFGERALVVDSRYDLHPNALAHRMAAEALREFVVGKLLSGSTGGPGSANRTP